MKTLDKTLGRGWMTTAAVALIVAGGLGVARAQQLAAPAPSAAAMDHGAMDHSKMGGMDHGGDAKSGGMGGMDHGGGGMGGMMGGMDHGGGDKMASGGGHSMMKNMMCRMTEHVEGRLGYLKAELKLNDSQAPQWNAFADAYRAAANKTKAQCDAMDAGGAQHAHGVLGHLGMMESHMVAHLESVRAIKAAVEPFLTSLSEEQKKTAETVMSGMMGLGMGGMMGGGGMGGMGGMDHGGGGGGMGGMMGGMQH